MVITRQKVSEKPAVIIHMRFSSMVRTIRVLMVYTERGLYKTVGEMPADLVRTFSNTPLHNAHFLAYTVHLNATV